MAQSSDTLLQEIRSRVDIVDFVGQYMQLKRAGANLRGLCPFHKEKTPSFNVHPEKQIYKCFGCGASGNVIGFLMQYEGLSFPEAVRHLAERAGVQLDKAGPAGPTRQLTERLKQIHKAAAALYAKLLQKEREGEVARNYLASRGLDLNMASELGLGYAPEGWDFVRSALAKQGFDLSELEQSGLVKRAAENQERYYDRFRNRLMFPISDPYGAVIAFGGRTLGEDQAKYINSPESPIYHKGQHLFGLQLAREAIKTEQCLVLVEGNFDCVLPWSRGIRHVAASLGTALTQAHARLVKRYTDRAVLLFDQDDAGQSSQRKAAELLLAEGFEVRIATLDKHKDPADYVLLEGADALRKRLSLAEDAVLFYARQAIDQMGDPTPRGRARAVAGILPLVEKIVDPIERSQAMAYVAEQLSVDEALVRQQLERRTQAPAAASAGSKAPPPTPADDTIVESEKTLLRAFVSKPELLVQYLEQHDADELRSPGARKILSVLSTLYADGRPLEVSVLLDHLESDALKQQVADWAFEAGTRDVEAEFREHLHILRARKLEHEMHELIRQQKEAEKSGDLELLRRLQSQLIVLTNERLAEHSQRAFRPFDSTKTGRNLLK